MKKAKGKEFEELSTWYGISDFNIKYFYKVNLNFRLKKLIRVYKDIYEYGYEPTKKSLDIITRKYKKEVK